MTLHGKLLVDFDCTLVDTVPYYLEALNLMKEEDVKAWIDYQADIPADVRATVLEGLKGPKGWRACKPVVGAPEALRWLDSMGVNVSILTANDLSAEPAIRAWLAAHVLDVDSIHLVGSEGAWMPERKVTFISHDFPGNRILVDDAPSVARYAIEQGLQDRLVIFDRPWNRGITGARRAYDWDDIVAGLYRRWDY